MLSTCGDPSPIKDVKEQKKRKLVSKSKFENVQVQSLGFFPPGIYIKPQTTPWKKYHLPTEKDLFDEVPFHFKRVNRLAGLLRYLDRHGMVYDTMNDTHVRLADEYHSFKDDIFVKIGIPFLSTMAHGIFHFLGDQLDDRGEPAKFIPLDWWITNGACGYLTKIQHVESSRCPNFRQVTNSNSTSIYLQLLIPDDILAIENNLVVSSRKNKNTRKVTSGAAQLYKDNYIHAGKLLFGWTGITESVKKNISKAALGSLLAMFHFSFFMTHGKWRDKDMLDKQSHEMTWPQQVRFIFGPLCSQLKTKVRYNLSNQKKRSKPSPLSSLSFLYSDDEYSVLSALKVFNVTPSLSKISSTADILLLSNSSSKKYDEPLYNDDDESVLKLLDLNHVNINFNEADF
jgi:hypothetical protein